MNLIEQLGYEKACKACDKEIKDGGYPYGLIKESLEYRRAKNIYEVGDWVVCESFKDLIRVIDILEDRLVVDTGIKTTPDSKNTMAMALPISMFRHATDKEIEQGYRDE